MAEVSIYKLDLSPGDFSFGTGPSWKSSNWGGSDTPVSGYPEFGEMENVRRNEGTGASSQNVIDAINTADYTISWITLCGVGDQTNGQFDCRGGGAGKPLKVRWKQFLKASSLAETGYGSPLVLANGGGGGTSSGLFSADVFFQLEMFQTVGDDFTWTVEYQKPGVSGYIMQSVSGSTGTADDAEHEIIATITPSSVASLPGSGSSVGATIPLDGSFDVTVDGVSVVSANGLKFVINGFETSVPNVFYGKTIWHGD